MSHMKGIRARVDSERVTLEIDGDGGTVCLELHPAHAFALGQALCAAAQESWQPVYAVPSVEIVRGG